MQRQEVKESKERKMFLREKESTAEHKLPTHINSDFFKNYLSPSERDLILVLGPHGSGKSTFVNYMTGCSMEMKKNDLAEEFVEAKAGHKEICRTEQGISAVTFYPQVVCASDTMQFLDCPAYDYNAGGAKEKISVLATQAAIRQAKSIRGAVFIISHYCFKQYSDFQEMAEYLVKTVRDVSQYTNSILFLVTHAPKRIEHSHILCRLKEHVALEENYRNGKTNIKNLFNLINQRIHLFNPTVEDHRTWLVDQFNKFTTIPKDNFIIPNYEKAHLDLNIWMESVALELMDEFGKRKELFNIVQQKNEEACRALSKTEKHAQSLFEEHHIHFACIHLMAKNTALAPAILKFIEHYIITPSPNDDLHPCDLGIANSENDPVEFKKHHVETLPSPNLANSRNTLWYKAAAVGVGVAVAMALTASSFMRKGS